MRTRWSWDKPAPPQGHSGSRIPDLQVGLRIVVLRIIDVLGPSIGLDIGRHEQMRRRNVATVFLLVERSIGLVDDLPSVQPQRLGNRADLVFALPYTLESHFASVPSGDVAG